RLPVRDEQASFSGLTCSAQKNHPEDNLNRHAALAGIRQRSKGKRIFKCPAGHVRQPTKVPKNTNADLPIKRG
ncbi:hypothetical protein, partial [Escherichia coli]|uniref:hypothetical protein n=1 Tax=Escherichia coli TaxID=562 RepID=UPI0019541980